MSQVDSTSAWSSYRIDTAGSVGRGLFSQKDIKAGETIFVLQRPLVSALDTSALEYACEWCFDGVGEAALGQASDPQAELKLLRCSSCKLVKYCNKTCQSQAWKHHHKLECKLFASLMPRVLPNATRMLVQMLLRKQKGSLSQEEWNAFLALQHHAGNFEDPRVDFSRRKALQITSLAAKEWGNSGEGAEFHKALAARTFVNTQTLVNPIFHPLGTCLDPLPALINHSCMPSAVIVFSGPVMTLRATSSIEKDEEFTISYIDSTMPKENRQAELSQRYFFTCKCKACLDNLCFGLPELPSHYAVAGKGGPSETPVHTRNLLNLDKAAFKCLTEAEADARHNAGSQDLSSASSDDPSSGYYLKLCKGLSMYLQQENLESYPPGRQPLAELRFDIIGELLARSLFVPAFILSLQNYFDTDPYHFPYVCHPVRVVHTYTLAKLANQVAFLGYSNDPDVSTAGREFGLSSLWPAISHALLGEVIACIDQSHGEDNRLAKQVRDEAQQIKATGNPEAWSIVANQKIGSSSLGLRSSDNKWQAVQKFSREGWKWYARYMSTKKDVDPGIKILIEEKPSSVPMLLRPPSSSTEVQVR